MHRETTNPDSIETGRQPITGSYEYSKSKLLAKAAIAAGTIALAVTAAAARPDSAAASPKMPEVGVFEPLLLSNDLQQSQRIAEMIKEAGFNSFEIRENYVQWEAGNVQNDWQAFCNAAQAGQEQNLHEYLTFQTYYTQGQPGYNENGGRGFMPTSATDYKKFNTTMITYLNGLSGPTAVQNPTGAHRCAGLQRPVIDVELGLINEANDPHFVTQQSDAQGNYLNPKEVVDLYAYEYPRLKAEAKKLGINLTINIGALNPTINNIDFISAMGKAITAEHINYRIADAWDGHIYWPGGTPLTVHPNAADIGPSDIPMLSAALDDNFGYKLQVVGGELGVQTYIPTDKRNLYQKIDLSQPTTDESGQGQQYTQALGVLACTPRVRGGYNMHFIDDLSGNPWALSGFEYSDETPKSDMPQIISANLAAKNGTITCPVNK